MPQCTLCDSESFDILDGLYFCTDCGTQSQDIQEEVQETFEVSTRLRVRQVGEKKSRKDNVDNYGKCWFTLEGFQILLKKQVEFLIGVGVNAKLKDIVGQMWFRFVQLTSETFLTEDTNQLQKKYIFARKRPRDNIGDYVPVDSIPRPVPRYMSQEIDPDALELSSEIAREEFYEDDDPTAGLFDEFEDEVADENSVAGSIGTPTLSKSRKTIGYMTFPHTLAFCYLALLWLQEPICISDLIRWARHGHMPYCDATTYFPSYMKLSASDVMTFTVTALPNKRTIRRLARTLKGFLSLPDFPEQNINLYISRFVTDLQLPACIHRDIHTLANSVKLEPSKPIPIYDDLAIAYIILSLKLIYGLDGKTEWALTELAVDITANQNSSYVPTWSDLINLITTCQTECAKRNIPFTLEEFNNLEDGRNYGEFCQQKIFGSWQAPFVVNRYNRIITGQKGLDLEKREEYAKLFRMFIKKDGMEDDHADVKNPSSFPLLCGKRCWLRKDMREKQLGSGSGLPKSPMNSDNLTTSVTPDYRTNPFQQVKKFGIPKEAIANYYSKGQGDGASPVEPHPSTGDAVLRESREYHNATPSQVDTATGMRYCPKPPDIVSFDFPRCVDHMGTSRTCAQYWKDSVLPDSLKQIVEICSKLIEAEPGIIYTKLRDLEMLIDKDY